MLTSDPSIDVVLSDINMPVMDGLTLLTKLNEVNRLLKTVMVSAYGDMTNIRAAMNRGAFDFVTKPIDFQDLEITINKTLDHILGLKQGIQVREELSAIQQELSVAARIQQSILPTEFPLFPHRNDFAIFAEMTAARQVGGDFYDFFLIDEERLGFVIGDVSTRTGDVEFCIGGHNPPYVFSQGQVRAVKAAGGMIVGILDQAQYHTERMRLTPGEGIMLFTDGVSEAEDPAENQFSEPRLESSLAALGGQPLEDVVRSITAEVKAFSAGAPQSDDITMLAVRYLG